MAVQSVECLILLGKSRTEAFSLGTGILTEVPQSFQAREGQYGIRRSRLRSLQLIIWSLARHSKLHNLNSDRVGR